MHQSATIRDFISGAIQDGADTVLDLNDCDYADSTFLGCIVLLHRLGTQNPGDFSVTASDVAREKLLTALQLQRVLSFRETPPECIGSPVELPVSSLSRLEFCAHLLETHQKLAELGGPSTDAFRKIADRLAAELGADLT